MYGVRRGRVSSVVGTVVGAVVLGGVLVAPASATQGEAGPVVTPLDRVLTGSRTQPAEPQGRSSTSSGPEGAATAGARTMTSTLAASATSTLPELASTCPTGQTVLRTYAVAGFEDGKVPNPEYSQGWSVARPADDSAPEGDLVALSRSEAGLATDHVVNPVYVPSVPGGSLVVSLTYRGTFTADQVGLYVNDGSGALAPTSTWRTVRVDATPFNTFGVADVYLDLVTGATAPPSSVEVDDVRVYACGTAPASGVRGDWTGDGLVDLLGTTTGGDLWLYPGRGTGRFSTGHVVGGGWSPYTWLGSPGDVTGDRRSDLVARDPDGALYLYRGSGAGTFAARSKVGWGWAGMTAMVTVGDMDLDGRPELVARRPDSSLQLYSFTATGGLTYRKQIGVGWNRMSWIIGMGDLNGDRRADLVGVNRDDGCLYAYSTSAALAFGRAAKVGCGWSSMTYLASPGDLDRDRLGDLLGRAADGTLWFYRGRSGGGVRNGVVVGSGWTGMRTLL